ncbi:uncharacterized protein LOC129271095 [Lytechinus pictus]|uniref:uncharacterized protein LOC129271095 n=1 Tax=Lytechinus pictus TaxID=7653 RepID=UPI0030B9F316
MFSPNKSSIREANDHLQALYQRISELENTVKEQASAIMHRDEINQANVKEAVRIKDLEISELHRTVAASEARIQKLVTQNKEKDAEIERLKSKTQLLEDACDNLPALESCLWSLKQANDLIISTGSVRSRHGSARSRSASGPLNPTSALSTGLHNDKGMEVSASGDSGSSSTFTGNGRGPGGTFVNSYSVAGNRSFSISDVDDDGESTTV